jgi:hypothetical protein
MLALIVRSTKPGQFSGTAALQFYFVVVRNGLLLALIISYPKFLNCGALANDTYQADTHVAAKTPPGYRSGCDGRVCSGQRTRPERFQKHGLAIKGRARSTGFGLQRTHTKQIMSEQTPIPVPNQNTLR